MARRPFSNVFAGEGVQTGDGRIITPNALRTMGRPTGIRWMLKELGWGHQGAVDLPGAIESWERVPGPGERTDLVASGWIDDELPHGAELAAHLDSGAPMGVSVDLDDVTVEVVDTQVVPVDDVIEIRASAGRRRALARFDRYDLQLGSSPIRRHARPTAVTAAAGEGDVDGEIWWTFSMDEVLERIIDGRLRTATAVGIPAFDFAELTLGAAQAAAGTPDVEADSEEADDLDVAASARRFSSGLVPVDCAMAAEIRTVTAGGGPVAPPSSWFEVPEPDTLTPLTVTADGQVYGHVWASGACHSASTPGSCLLAPRSSEGLPWFHVGYVVTAEGRPLPTGTLTIGGGHADDRLGAVAAREQYDDVATAWADVRVTEGRFGGWACGAARPGLTDTQLRAIRGSVPSGDWRGVGGRSELIGVHQVNRPGYPVARLDPAGQPLAIVAAGALAAGEWTQESGPTVAAWTELADQVRRLRDEVTAPARARLRAAGTASARQRLRNVR